MNDRNWQTFFDYYAPQYMDEVFVRATLQEVDFLIEHLRLAPGARLLDLGCGTGRHAIELAKRGYSPTGVDLSQGMLAEAARAAQAAGVSVEWIHSPAEAFTTSTRFDAAYCVCEGALCLLGQDDPPYRDLPILRNLHDAIKPGAPALITVLNGMRFLRLYSEDDIRAGRFDPLTMTERGAMEVVTPEGKRAIPTRERGYVPTEIRLMLEVAGFVVEHVGGGTAGNWRMGPPELDEMELMAIVRRPE